MPYLISARACSHKKMRRGSRCLHPSVLSYIRFWSYKSCLILRWFPSSHKLASLKLSTYCFLVEFWNSLMRNIDDYQWDFFFSFLLQKYSVKALELLEKEHRPISIFPVWNAGVWLRDCTSHHFLPDLVEETSDKSWCDSLSLSKSTTTLEWNS